MHCGGSFFSSLVSGVKSLASNPMVQGLVKAAAPGLLSAARHYAPGVVSAAEKYGSKALAHPMGQQALGALRRQVGLGRRRKHHSVHGAMLPLGHATPGEAAYASMRASGTHKGQMRMTSRKAYMQHGGLNLGSLAKSAMGSLGPIGSLAGPLMDLISGPPPPPPKASFHAVRAEPVMAARPHGIGRGKSSMVHHSCPHCGGVHAARHTTQKHKCKMCGGAWYSGIVNAVKSVASNPMVQSLVKAAAPGLLSAARHYAPGVVSAAEKYGSKALAHPMGQAALGAVRRQVGLGKRTRAPTAHSKAVGHVMRETGMGLSAASKHVKHHGLARHFA